MKLLHIALGTPVVLTTAYGMLNLPGGAIPGMTPAQPASMREGEPASYQLSYSSFTELDMLINGVRNTVCRDDTSLLYQKRLLTLLPMIRNGANVNITLVETKGNTALHYACGSGNYALVRWLLEHGANPQAVTHKGATPMQCVGGANASAICALLNQYIRGGRVAPPPSRPVYSGGDRSSLEPLIARMRALRCREAESALYQRRLLTLLPLIRDGADVNITLAETKGNTALHYSCAIGSLSITKWLLEHGANPNAVTNKGATPLMCVGSDNHAAIVRLLKQYGAVR